MPTNHIFLRLTVSEQSWKGLREGKLLWPMNPISTDFPNNTAAWLYHVLPNCDITIIRPVTGKGAVWQLLISQWHHSWWNRHKGGRWNRAVTQEGNTKLLRNRGVLPLAASNWPLKWTLQSAVHSPRLPPPLTGSPMEWWWWGYWMRMWCPTKLGALGDSLGSTSGWAVPVEEQARAMKICFGVAGGTVYAPLQTDSVLPLI